MCGDGVNARATFSGNLFGCLALCYGFGNLYFCRCQVRWCVVVLVREEYLGGSWREIASAVGCCRYGFSNFLQRAVLEYYAERLRAIYHASQHGIGELVAQKYPAAFGITLADYKHALVVGKVDNHHAAWGGFECLNECRLAVCLAERTIVTPRQHTVQRIRRQFLIVSQYNIG